MSRDIQRYTTDNEVERNPFKCTYCDKRFSQKTAMLRHANSHLGEYKLDEFRISFLEIAKMSCF